MRRERANAGGATLDGVLAADARRATLAGRHLPPRRELNGG